MSTPSDGKTKRKRHRSSEENKERRQFNHAKKQADKQAEEEALVEARGDARGEERANRNFQHQLKLIAVMAKASGETKQKCIEADRETKQKCIEADRETKQKCIEADRETKQKCIEADQILGKLINSLLHAAIPQQGDTPKEDADSLSVPVLRSTERKNLDSTTGETLTTPSSTSPPSLASDTGTDEERGPLLTIDTNIDVDEIQDLGSTTDKKRKRNSGGGYHQVGRIHDLERENSSLIRENSSLIRENSSLIQSRDEERRYSTSLRARNEYLERQLASLERQLASQSRGSGDYNHSARGNDSTERMTPRSSDYTPPDQNHDRSPYYSQSDGSGDHRNNDPREDCHTYNGRGDQRRSYSDRR